MIWKGNSASTHERISVLVCPALDIVWRISYSIATWQILIGAAFHIDTRVVIPIVASRRIRIIPEIGATIVRLVFVVYKDIMIESVVIGRIDKGTAPVAGESVASDCVRVA